MTTNATTAQRPVIYASSMLLAQAVKLDADSMAWLRARADRFRALVGAPADELTTMSVEVRDPATGARIGQVNYEL